MMIGKGCRTRFSLRVLTAPCDPAWVKAVYLDIASAAAQAGHQQMAVI
jgi:hypothetical protein